MKRAALFGFVYCSLASLSLSAPVETEKKEIASPDGKFMAQILSKRAEFTEDTVTVTSRESGSQAEFPMTSQGGGNGRYVLESEWSGDSKSFVFSTFSAGGHSGWNFKTVVYSVDTNKFVSVDEKVRAVTDEDFQLLLPHTLQVDTLNPIGIDYPSMKRTVDLATLFR
jgi:hypothetical protein